MERQELDYGPNILIAKVCVIVFGNGCKEFPVRGK